MESATPETTKAAPTTCTVSHNVIVDAHVRAEFPRTWIDHMTYDAAVKGWREATPEEIGEKLEDKCKDFEEFLRDHRSQDVVSLEVVYERATLCSRCHERWEPAIDDETGETFCARCGATLAK